MKPISDNLTQNIQLTRRGFALGETGNPVKTSAVDGGLRDWQQGRPVLLTGACDDMLTQHSSDIRQAFVLYQAILRDESCDGMFEQAPYASRLATHFESLGCSVNEGDDQEIETVLFDVVGQGAEQGELLAEDLWMKVSWLSFYESDASLRFRFSFGEDHVEDVAADTVRQDYAALLAEAVFPESAIITNNTQLHTQIKTVLDCQSFKFVERIVYFNAPDGGAYLHHDLERGHAGVVYAQLSGVTFWLALPHQQLVQEVIEYIQACEQKTVWPDTVDQTAQQQLTQLAETPDKLSAELDSFANNALIHLINETQDFIQQLIQHGHGRLVQTGDVLLLPQETQSHCCWHTVFSLGNEPGQALSFAVRCESSTG